MHVLLIPETSIIYAKSQNKQGLSFLQNETKFMNTSSFTIYFRKISACSKVFVEWYT